MPTNNPLEVLNNQRKFLFASCGKNYYFRVITKPEDMQARHDCTELLLNMLNILECKNLFRNFLLIFVCLHKNLFPDFDLMYQHLKTKSG